MTHVALNYWTSSKWSMTKVVLDTHTPVSHFTTDILNPNPRLGQQHTCALHSAPLTRQYKKRPSTRNAQSTVSSHQSFFQSLLCRSQLTVISHFSNETLPVCDYTQLSVISCQAFFKRTLPVAVVSKTPFLTRNLPIRDLIAPPISCNPRSVRSSDLFVITVK